VVIAFILFALTGFVFGWAIPTRGAWIVPILIPLLIAFPMLLKQGFSGRWLLDLFIALAVTVIGIIAGRIVAHRTESGHAEPDEEAAAGA
jgi:hypothetical protein